MDYYKLISGDNFIGLVTNHDFRMFQHKHNIILSCDVEHAQYVQCGNSFYRANWMVPISTKSVVYDVVEVIRIDKAEYDILYNAVENGEDIEVYPEQYVPEEIPSIDPFEKVTVDYVKQSKISEMSFACNKAIESGFDIALSDNIVYHFSLTTQDQLNLITLQSMIAAGETHIPYHADGELCRYYSVDDLTDVINAATAHKTFHVTYFNSLKVYVSAMDNMSDISAIQYGVSIPDEYQSDILKSMYASMAVTNDEENN